MTLIDYPDQISITTGSVSWLNKNGINTNTTIILTKVSGEDKWTEDGTDTANDSTNRMKLEPVWREDGEFQEYGEYIKLSNSNAWEGIGAFYHVEFQIDKPSGLTFLDLYNANVSMDVTDPWIDEFLNGDFQQDYQDLFSDMSAGSSGGSSGKGKLIGNHIYY